MPTGRPTVRYPPFRHPSSQPSGQPSSSPTRMPTKYYPPPKPFSSSSTYPLTVVAVKQTFAGVTVQQAKTALFLNTYKESMAYLLRIPVSSINVTSVESVDVRRARMLLATGVSIGTVITATDTNPTTLTTALEAPGTSSSLTSKMSSNPSFAATYPTAVASTVGGT